VKRAAFVLLVVLAGCSSARRETVASGPKSMESQTEELARLQRRIASLRESATPEVASDPDRCSRMRSVAVEICRCAERICVLAGELGEDDAHRSCTRARSDCEQARTDAEACR